MAERHIQVVAFRGGEKARLVVHGGLDEHSGLMLDRESVVELIDALNTALARLGKSQKCGPDA